MSERDTQVRPNRFGNPEMVIKMLADKKGFPVGWFRVRGKLYKVKLSKGRKTDSKGREVLYWVSITALPAQQNASTGFM